MQGTSLSERGFVAAWRSIPRAATIAVGACAAMVATALAAASLIAPAPLRAEGGSASMMAEHSSRAHLGVSTCAGSTCHGHSVPDGNPVRQDELLQWQQESSPTGAHSRAYRAIVEPRGQAIIRRMGLDSAGVRNECLGCHASPGAVKVSEGVDCETCHGAAGGWISSHYTVG
jgi:hypothetical protein